MAATDVTGFGLLGHGLEMARASGTRFVFDAAAMPLLDGALELARAGVETGGAAHNRRFVADALTLADRRARGAGDAGPRSADERRPAGRDRSGVASTRSRRALDAVGVPHWRIGRVEAATTPAVALL